MSRRRRSTSQTDSTLDAGDTQLPSRSVPPLEPGASSDSSSLTLPQGLPGGTYYLIAKADADDVVPEFDEANNVSSPKSLVIGTDFQAWLELPNGATAVMPGGAISVIDETRSRTRRRPPRRCGIYLSTDATLDAGDVQSGSRAVPALGAGATHSGTTRVTIPTGTPAGAYYILVKADADDLVLELNEGNNFVPPARAITVGTDMIIGLDVPASAGTIAGGATVPVTDVTRNNRAVAVPGSMTRFYLSSNPVLDAGDVLVGSRGIGVGRTRTTTARHRGDDSDGARGDVLPHRQGGRGQHGGGDRRGQQHRGLAGARRRRRSVGTSWRGWSCRAGRRR